MLSILPKHVADEMLKDMKKDPSQKEMQQFNTMYMYRHENVRWGWLLPMPWSTGKISQFLVFRARKALKGDCGGGGVAKAKGNGTAASQTMAWGHFLIQT